MAIYRGIGGAGDSTTDATITDVTEQATNAAASASAAATSATNAANSESNALSYSNIATTKASQANDSANNAATSESNAASSETAAAASAAAASTSESNASTSETNAATSEANAAASYDSFDDRYLGAKASAPTTDNDGDALITGALYFNTVGNKLQVWTGTAWGNIEGDEGVVELNDLTASVTWANVPDANITESSVTQHQAALSITESQISDLQSYLTSFTETNDLTAAVTWANVPDANITQSSVTQHQAALSITESQISDLDHYTDADVDTHLNTGTATSSQVLSWTGTDYDWVDAASGGGDLVDDTTPQLGGDLDTNGNNINFGDNDRAQFGASSDLQIFHDGSNSIITDLGTGDLLLGGNKIALMDAARTIKYAQGQGSDGSITLYKSDSPKLQTTATGVTVTGTVTATAFSGDGSALTGISGGGKILQVVFNHVDTIASYLIDSATPDTTQQIAALNTSITPTASDSKILVTFSFCGEGNEENVWRLYRGNTEIGRTTQSTSQWAGFKPALSDGSLGWTQTSQHFVYIDSPATTSSITYNIRAAESYNVNNYFRLNRVYNGTNAGAVTQELGTSQVILMEIGA